MRNLFTKTLRDKRAFIIGWGLGLGFIGYVMTIFYPAFHQDDALSTLIGNLPPALKGLVGSLDNLKELSTYLGSQLFDIRIPIFLSVLTIILSVGLSVSEEERGQLRTLVGLPLSRSAIVVQKWLAIVVICLVSTLATLVGIKIGVMVIGETLDYMVLVRLGATMWLLAVALASMIFGIGLATGKKGLTMGVGVLITVGSFLLTTFATSVDWLHDYEKYSLLHYFPAADIAKGVIEPFNVLVYVVIIAASLLVAFLCFRRRDLRG
jgi:ABC-2 type transport system permease protein